MKPNYKLIISGIASLITFFAKAILSTIPEIKQYEDTM